MTQAEFLTESHNVDRYISEAHWDIAKSSLLKIVSTPYTREHECTALAYCYLNTLGGKVGDELAARWARKAIALDPQSGHAFAALAEAVLEQNDYVGCVSIATHSLACKHPDLFAHYLRARANTQLHKYNEALKDLEVWESFIYKFDKKQTTLNVQGEILEKLGRTDEAIKKYKSYMAVHPEDAIKDMVRCLQNAKRYPEAIAEASELIELHVEDSDAYNLRAYLKAQSKDWKGAIEDYNHAIDLSPTATYYRNRAKAYEALGMANLAKLDLANAEKSSF